MQDVSRGTLAALWNSFRNVPRGTAPGPFDPEAYVPRGTIDRLTLRLRLARDIQVEGMFHVELWRSLKLTISRNMRYATPELFHVELIKRF
jgi:hypothetical protein